MLYIVCRAFSSVFAVVVDECHAAVLVIDASCCCVVCCRLRIVGDCILILLLLFIGVGCIVSCASMFVLRVRTSYCRCVTIGDSLLLLRLLVVTNCSLLLLVLAGFLSILSSLSFLLVARTTWLSSVCCHCRLWLSLSLLLSLS